MIFNINPNDHYQLFRFRATQRHQYINDYNPDKEYCQHNGHGQK